MVMAIFLLMMYQEKTGHFPLLRRYQKKFEKELTEAEKAELFRNANQVAMDYSKKDKDVTLESGLKSSNQPRIDQNSLSSGNIDSPTTSHDAKYAPNITEAPAQPSVQRF